MFPSLTVDEHLTAVARPGPLDDRARLRALPAPRGAPRQLRQPALRRRAADARDRARADGQPALLLLDEPMEGLAPIIVQELVRVIRELVEDGGMAVIVVEQHAKLALALTRHAIVLERGQRRAPVVERGARGRSADASPPRFRDALTPDRVGDLLRRGGRIGQSQMPVADGGEEPARSGTGPMNGHGVRQARTVPHPLPYGRATTWRETLLAPRGPAPRRAASRAGRTARRSPPCRPRASPSPSA